MGIYFVEPKDVQIDDEILGCSSPYSTSLDAEFLTGVVKGALGFGCASVLIRTDAFAEPLRYFNDEWVLIDDGDDG